MKKNPSVPLPPVSLEDVYTVVIAATSQDPTQIKEATDRLKEILERPGALDCLHEIAIQKTVPLHVRQQSIIQFKNNLGQWRLRRYVSDENRVRIRSRSWLFLQEEDDLIFNCHKAIMAKIARTDYPNNWVSLFPDLLSAINHDFDSCYGSPSATPPVLRLRRSLQILNALIKELAAVKIGSGIKAFNSVLEQTYAVLYGYYSSLSPVIAVPLSPATLGLHRTADDLMVAHLVYKCLVKVSAWVWPKIEQDDYAKYQTWFQEFFKSSAFQMQALFERRIELTRALLGSNSMDPVVLSSVVNLTRHIRVFGKFFRRIQTLSSKQFVLLPMCTDIILYYWSKVVQASSVSPEFISDSPSAVFPIRFLVQAMVLFRDSLAQWTPIRKDGTKNENTLTQDFVDGAVKLLVTRFIPLTPSDLEKWMTDPEEWINREENDNEQWEFELRPCGERVLVTLASQYKEYVTPLLKGTFDDVIERTAIDLPEIIAKEAVYCAIGRCCLRLKDAIPFQRCLEHTFVAEAQNMNQNYPIIKRRIAWLIGKWVSDDCFPANHSMIWDILVHLLQGRGTGTDMAVRLTAATALRECIDTLTFDVTTFEPFIATVVPQLLGLIVEVDTLESRRRIINCLNHVIQRSETRVTPFIDTIAQHIPRLWSSAGDDGESWLLKGALVHTVVSSLQACKEGSVGLTDLVVPLVRECLSPQASLQLDKDGMILWATALRNSGSVVQTANEPSGLFNLLPQLVTILLDNIDLLGSITEIVESYYTLDAAYVLKLCAVDLFRAYNQALSRALPVNMKGLIVSLTLLFQLAPASLWGGPLHISGLFASLLNTLQDEKLSAILLTEYIYMFSRLALADRQIFLQLMSATAGSQGVSESQLWESLLDQWWIRFDNMSEPRHRKLTAMGLASLVSTGRPEVLERLPNEISNLWLDVFGELIEQERVAGQPGSAVLSLYWDQPFSSLYLDIEGTPEHARRNIIFENDLVRTTQLTAFIQARLAEAQIACGGPQVFQERYLSKIDPAVLKQIEAVLKGSMKGL